VARLIPLPPLRASVSSTSTSSGCSPGTQASARVNTTRPIASMLHRARAKKRWNTEICRAPTAPDATATAVIVRRPWQRSQPATTSPNSRYVGAVKHPSNAASSGANVCGTITSGMAPSLVADTSRVIQGAMFRQLSASGRLCLQNGGSRA
jgi:hypothetical protein